MRTKIALLFAVVLGILAVLGIQAYLSRKDIEHEKRATRVSITVALENLNAGTTLKPTHIAERRVDEAAVTNDHVLWEEARAFAGRQVTRKVYAGKALLRDYFLTSPDAEKFDTKKVDTTLRAITIGTDQIAGVAGLITPGSRVDCLCTFRMASRGPESAATVITKVIARSVKILAVDNRTNIRIPVRGRGARGGMNEGYSSVTVLVSPLEASLLTFAQQTGKISFALRNPEDSGLPAVNDITLAEFEALIAEAERQREQRLKRLPKGTIGLR